MGDGRTARAIGCAGTLRCPVAIAPGSQRSRHSKGFAHSTCAPPFMSSNLPLSEAFVDVVRLCPEVCFHIFVFAGASFLRTVLSLALRVEKLLDQPLTMLRARSASRAASAMAARAPAAGAARLPLNFIQQRGMAGKDIKFGNDARALLLQVRLQHRAWGASMKARR